MKLRKNKQGGLLENVLIVIFTSIIFFALWPAVKALIDVAVAVNLGNNPTVDFMMGSIGFVILLGMLKWIFSTVGGSGTD